LAEYAEKENIPYPLLSDIDSEVIRRYGIFNTQVKPEDGVFYGIPYPGVFLADKDGVVTAKFFQDNYKKRDSAELIIDAALGHVQLDDAAPQSSFQDDDDVRITAAIHGGAGDLRQGIVRELLVRVSLRDGLHIYGEPVPEGMVPTTVSVTGPPGLVVNAPIYPPSVALRLREMDVELQVWSGEVDIRVPIFPNGELVSEVRPLDQDSVRLSVNVRYQACDDVTCLLPRSKTLELEVPLAVTDVPALPIHMGHANRRKVSKGLRAHQSRSCSAIAAHFRLSGAGLVQYAG
jgi:hypothetical protein